MASWPIVICSLCVVSFSIVTACVPYLKPFFASLESGMLRTDDLRRRDGTATFSNNSRINTSQIIGGRSRRAQHDGGFSVNTLRFSPWTQAQNETVGQKALTVVETGGEEGRQVIEADAESQTSLAHIIRQTRSWEVSRTRGAFGHSAP